MNTGFSVVFRINADDNMPVKSFQDENPAGVESESQVGRKNAIVKRHLVPLSKNRGLTDRPVPVLLKALLCLH